MRSRWDLGPESRQTEGYTIAVMSITRLTMHHARCQPDDYFRRAGATKEKSTQ
jgi:methyl coenzyme M reductase subunit C-like uncharacterized protein (methanogenesis marker protein 7)